MYSLFRTISMRISLIKAIINTENLPKRFLTTDKRLFTARDILGQRL